MLIADMKSIGAVYSGTYSVKEIRSGERIVWKKDAGFVSAYDREVEYLLARDTDTYIITDIKLKDLTRYDIEIKCWCGIGSTMPFGVRDVAASSGNINQFSMIHSASGQYQIRVMSGAVGSVTSNNTDPHVFRWVGSERLMYIDGNRFSMSPVSLSATQSLDSKYGLALFGCNSGGFVDNMGKARCIYYFKVWYDGELIADYIPVIDNHSVPCFYNNVTEKLVRCSGTGKFSYAEKGRQINYDFD